MSNTAYYLAQFNIARLKHPIDDPRTAEFVANLDKINLLAEESDGFIWRLKDETGNATEINIYNDPLMIINMSVWESINHLFEYTYSSEHVDVFRKRGKWFENKISPHLVLWWVPQNKLASAENGKERLQYLSEKGPTPFAFTFKKKFTVEDVKHYSQK